jgi:phytoene/squalene synthetase
MALLQISCSYADSTRHEVYFEKLHPTLPKIHKYRYLASLNLPAHMQPPICLRYAMWAAAASVSEKYMQYEDVLYERARKYVEAAEMKVGNEPQKDIYPLTTHRATERPLSQFNLHKHGQ